MRGASILTILLALAGASLLRAQTRLYFQESKNFRIVYYSPSHEYLAPVLIRSLENALRFYNRTFGYQPPAPITVLIRDFEDFGNGSAGSVPENVIQIGMSRFSLVFETMSAAERMTLLSNHELGHIVVGDNPAGPDSHFRRLFHGKITPSPEDPISIGFSFLASPRQYSPRWFHEGTATFFETWMGGGFGRALGGYDEMLFRSLVRDERYIYEYVGLESEGTAADFQVGANSYLYGTRFLNHVALKYGPDKLRQWIVRERSSRAYFETEFRRVFGVSLREEWRSWIEAERKWQTANLATIRKFPVTRTEKITPKALGSVSRAFHDPASNSLYLAVRHLGKAPYLAQLSLDTGKLTHLTHVEGAALYDVSSLAFDPAGHRIFFTTNSNAIRGLSVYHLDTRKTEIIARELRVGDLAFHPKDNSLWAIQHVRGQSSLVRMTAPYKDGVIIQKFPYATDVSDLDFSPDGEFLAASLVDETGKQRLIRYRVADFDKPEFNYEVLQDFEYNTPGSFVHSNDGRYLYGSAYTTGASNLFRVEIATKKLEALSNAETGLFRPLPLTGDTLLAVEYSADGFTPVKLPIRVLEDVNAIPYLGQQVVDKFPQLKTWKLPSRSTLDDNAVRAVSGEYKPLYRMRWGAIFPIVQGYKSSPAGGVRLDFHDPLELSGGFATLTFSPDRSLPLRDRIHAAVEGHYWGWSLAAYMNRADFYDLFGPTKVSRRGFGLKLDRTKSLLFQTQRTLDLKFSLAGYSGLDRLPEYQNIAASHSRYLSGTTALQYKHFTRTLGAVEDERGDAWTITTRLNYTGPQTFPKIWATYDKGVLTPLRNSSLWLRSSAGRAFGDSRDTFASFYFGGFGNNWVDKADFARYREYYAFPGVRLNAIGARDFAKSTVEWNLPPVRFRSAGTTALYFNWVRFSLFSGVLGANLGDSASRTAYTNAGAQADFRLVWFTYLKSTFSVGFAGARDRLGHVSSEKMISLKLN